MDSEKLNDLWLVSSLIRIYENKKHFTPGLERLGKYIKLLHRLYCENPPKQEIGNLVNEISELTKNHSDHEKLMAGLRSDWDLTTG